MSEENPKTAETPSRDERIGRLAYQIWEEEGRPEGRHEDHWFRASAMVDAEEQATSQAEPLPSYLSRVADDMPAAAMAAPVEKAPAATKEPTLEELTRRMRAKSAA